MELTEHDEVTSCKHCGIEITEWDHGWADAEGDSESLVYCTDQDETHDGIRHEPEDEHPFASTMADLREAMLPLMGVRDDLEGAEEGSTTHTAWLALERAFDEIDGALRTLEADDVEGPCRYCDDVGPHEGRCCAGCFDVLADADAWELPLIERRALVVEAGALT